MNSSSFLWGNFIITTLGIFIVCLGIARLTSKSIQNRPSNREKFILLNGAFILSCLLTIHFAYPTNDRMQAEGMIGMLTLYTIFASFWTLFSKE